VRMLAGLAGRIDGTGIFVQIRLAGIRITRQRLTDIETKKYEVCNFHLISQLNIRALIPEKREKRKHQTSGTASF